MSDQILDALIIAQELEANIDHDRVTALDVQFNGESFSAVVAALAVWYGNQLGQSKVPAEAISAHIAAFSLVAAIEAKRVLQLENKNGLQ